MREACGAGSVDPVMVMAMTGRARKGSSSIVGTPSTRSQEGQREAPWVIMATDVEASSLEGTGEWVVMKETWLEYARFTC